MIANWAGNVRFKPRRLHRPRSMDELRQALDGHDRVRAVGSAHSFNRVAGLVAARQRGRRLGCLAEQIDEVELLTADGELVTLG